MSPRERFRAEEIEVTGLEAADAAAIARRLERYADNVGTPTAAGLPDVVMGLVAAEPVPAPVRALRVAAGAGRLRLIVAALGDAWRVAMSGGRPLGARASAFGLVAVLFLAIGSAGAGAAAGAWNAFNPARPPVVASPSATPRPSPTPMLVTDSPTPPPAVTPSPTPTESDEEDRPGDSQDSDDDTPSPHPSQVLTP